MLIKDLLFKLFKRKRGLVDNRFTITYGMSVGEDEIYTPAFPHGCKVLICRADGCGKSIIKTVNNTCYPYNGIREVICRPSIMRELLLSNNNHTNHSVIITEILE